MVFDVPILQIGSTINGVVFNEETVTNICDQFYSNNQKIPCLDNKNQEVGEIRNLRVEDNRLIASLVLSKQGYTQANPVVSQVTKILKINVK